MKMKSLQITAAAIFSTGAAHAAILSTGLFDAPAFEYSTADGFEAEIHDETTDQGLEPSEHSFRINMQSTTVFQGNSYFWLPSNEAVADNNGVPYVGVGLEELTQSDWGTNGNGDIAIIFSGVNYSGRHREFRFLDKFTLGDPALRFLGRGGGCPEHDRRNPCALQLGFLRSGHLRDHLRNPGHARH